MEEERGIRIRMAIGTVTGMEMGMRMVMRKNIRLELGSGDGWRN